jgi:hypothetical protein
MDNARHRHISERIGAFDWARISCELNSQGWSILPKLLGDEECDGIASLYAGGHGFRSHIIMARHGFGKGEYKYFAYPLPDLIAGLRGGIFPHLVPIANDWNRLMGIGVEYPPCHADYVALCHAAGQIRPTPLLLKYEEGDYNCLHQDLYGELAFPMQAVFLLSSPEIDFSGGEFILTEQRPRMQSRAQVIPLQKGDAAIFAVSHRPQQGSRGSYRVTMRHGVSTVRSGNRLTAGVIFHDAR